MDLSKKKVQLMDLYTPISINKINFQIIENEKGPHFDTFEIGSYYMHHVF